MASQKGNSVIAQALRDIGDPDQTIRDLEACIEELEARHRATLGKLYALAPFVPKRFGDAHARRVTRSQWERAREIVADLRPECEADATGQQRDDEGVQ